MNLKLKLGFDLVGKGKTVKQKINDTLNIKVSTFSVISSRIFYILYTICPKRL